MKDLGNGFSAVEMGDGMIGKKMMEANELVADLYVKLGTETLLGQSPGGVLAIMAACIGRLYGHAKEYAELKEYPHGWKGTDEEIRDIAETFFINAQRNGNGEVQ